MREVKPVKYDELNCSGEDEVVCPYCGNENEMENYDEEQDKEYRTECEECGKTFMYSCNFSVTYNTQPVENHYIEERKTLVKRLESYEQTHGQYEWQKEMALKMEHDIDCLDKWIEDVLQDETEQ